MTELKVDTFLKDPSQDSFNFENTHLWFNKLTLLLLPFEHTLNMLSKLDESEISDISPILLANKDRLTRSADEHYAIKLSCANVLWNKRKKNFDNLFKLAFARHCLNATSGNSGKNRIPTTMSLCQSLRHNLVKRFDEILERFQAECERSENVCFYDYSTLGANYLGYFFDQTLEHIKTLCNSNGKLLEQLSSYRKQNEEVLSQLDELLVLLSRLQTEKFRGRNVALDRNLSQNATNMYRAVSHTLPYEDLESMCGHIDFMETNSFFEQVKADRRFALEILLDSLFLQISSEEALEKLITLRSLLARCLQKNLRRFFVSLSSDNFRPTLGSGTRDKILADVQLDTGDLDDDLASLKISEEEDPYEYEDMLQSMKERGIDPWQTPLETHILIETHRHYPHSSKGAFVDVGRLGELLSTKLWGNRSPFVCNRKTINELMRLTVNFCTHAIKYDPVKKNTEGCREKRDVLRALLNQCGGTLSRALTIALPYEVMRPFFVSPAIVTIECSSSLNLREIGKEVHKACLLLIMLSAVRNLVFVPSTETEGNTVIVTGSACDSYTLNPRDTNICMVSEQYTKQTRYLLNDVVIFLLLWYNTFSNTFLSDKRHSGPGQEHLRQSTDWHKRKKKCLHMNQRLFLC